MTSIRRLENRLLSGEVIFCSPKGILFNRSVEKFVEKRAVKKGKSPNLNRFYLFAPRLGILRSTLATCATKT